MAVTIREVAREAGVSIATVSRVFNDSGPVNEDTRQRIIDAARRLRYIPNGAARSLITSKTQTLGVLLPDLYGEFFSEVIRGIDHTARQHLFHLLLSSSHNDRDEIQAALRAMQGRVDGLIIMYPDLDAAALRDNLSDGLPVVLLNCHIDGDPFDAIVIDNYGGAYAMTRHLIEHGHRHVALITGGRENYDAAERVRGYRAALRDGGVAWSEELETEGAFTEVSGYEATRRILDRTPRPTAIFASNDSMAIGALSALREAGLRVPDDVAVVGFDDIPIAGYVSPRLSSMHVPISELGARAMERLIEAIREEPPHAPRREEIATTLVVRDSCGCSPERTSFSLSGKQQKQPSQEEVL